MKTISTITRISVLSLLSLSSCLWAAAPAYKMEKSFGQDEFKVPPVGVSMDSKDQLYVLLTDGTVVTFDTTGKKVGAFKADMTPAPAAMTVADGKIYLFSTVTVEKVREYQGKKVTVQEATGVNCCIYGPTGTKDSELKLPGIMSATAAHFIGKELAIADYAKQSIVYFAINGGEGKMTRKIDKVFRLCCGIFDFCPGADNEIVAANLGAFKVQTYKGSSRPSHEFGARGEKENEFHGCCNPVNVACLTDGSIVTVEKATTRVKIYDKRGKNEKIVNGLTELVEGCTTIPVVVDSKNMIYLASSQKRCIVKCVPDADAAKSTAGLAR